MSDFYQQPNSKKARLLIDDQVVSGLKLNQSLEEFGLISGQLIYIEFLEPNNTWPTDIHRASQKKSEESPTTDIGIVGKTNGLYNLGNTCYMNSAL
jgi:ubiquitin C-terminal hydrolase